MRKALWMFMVCVMTAAAAAGCASSSGGTGGEPSAAAGNATESAAAQPAAQAEDGDGETGKEGNAGGTGTAAKPDPGSGPEAAEKSSLLRIGSLKGPTTMGLVSLMDKASRGEAEGAYEFTMVTAADELVGKMASGALDIALVPANMAGILYQKTGQGIRALNINTLGVLYVAAGDESIKNISDLKGKTVYMTGKGTTPDYVFQYLLTASGLKEGDVALEYKSEAAEVAAVLKEQPDAIGLLPQPFVTAAMAQNENLKMVMDLTEQWDNLQVQGGGRLVTGVTVCRSQVLEDPAMAEAVNVFMKEHSQSADFANANVEEAARLVAEAGIIEKAPVAQKALPYCSIVCIDGEDMKEMVSGYLNVLYRQDPASVGGQVPDDGFYYLP